MKTSLDRQKHLAMPRKYFSVVKMKPFIKLGLLILLFLIKCVQALGGLADFGFQFWRSCGAAQEEMEPPKGGMKRA